MRLLAIDTATEACSAAVWNDGEVSSRDELAPRRHTELLLPMIEAVMTEQGLAKHELDALAFGRGPGSFTGVRIATSVIQGLALATGLGVVPVSTLAAMAQGARRRHDAVAATACLDARMGEIYWGNYRCDQNGVMQLAGDELLSDPIDLVMPARGLAVGPGFGAYPQLSAGYDGIDQTLLPSARDMLPLALEQYRRAGALPAAAALPTYLRDKVSWNKP